MRTFKNRLLVRMMAGCCAQVLFVCIAICSSPAALGFDRVGSELSRTKPAQALRFKGAAIPPTSFIYEEVPIERILKASLANNSSGRIPQQVGIGRVASRERVRTSLPASTWKRLPGGGFITRVEFTSPLALAMRVGLEVDGIDPRAELRFSGSDRPEQVVSVVTGAQMRKLMAEGRIYWTPVTDGQTQTLEIFRPASVEESGVRIVSPAISHLLGNSRNGFSMGKSLGEAASCQIDAVCKVPELGADYVNAVASTARMVYVGSITGDTYACTATLINDKVPESQIPYLLTTNTCIYTQYGSSPSTVNTFWGYETVTCGGTAVKPIVQLSGGTVGLVGYGTADVHGSGSLLRMNEAAPAGAVFSGWDTAPLVADQQVIGIHHPQGDVKKVVIGKFRKTYAYIHNVGWTSGGFMEPASWGSGIFTPDSGGYVLRGVARNGSANCQNSRAFSNPENAQEYGRFDLFYPVARPWLAPGEAAVFDFRFTVSGLEVTFEAIHESDTYDHKWMLGDVYSASGTKVIHTYREPGIYNVTLSAPISGGGTRTITKQVGVQRMLLTNGSQPLIRGDLSAQPAVPAPKILPKAGPTRDIGQGRRR